MPLPDGGKTCWPPEHCEPINAQIAEWAAWYSGDAAQLAAIYGGDTNTTDGEFFASEAGGFKATARRALRAVRRWFWGNSNPTGQPRQRLHVPIAGDIAAASADLLFAEPPTVTADDKATQERLDELLDDGAHATLLEAAEIAAGLGGVYLRICWDPSTQPDRPWFAAVHPDAAVPEFRFGRLTAVTFWRVIAKTRTKVVRHLERHELSKVLHGVYEGDDDELGHLVPLTDYPDTAGLADERLVNGNEIATGSEKLAAVYVPNMRPNRVWRNTAGAAALGRSDYAGVEPLMDALDLTESSWIRDVDLGKARLVVPHEYLLSHGKGQGASVDLDREVYEPINVMGGDEGKPEITQVQFDIRVEEHERTTDALKAAIVGSAGYSAQTFGLPGKGEGSAQTATEVVSKDRRSLITRGRKIRYWRPGLADLLEVYLDIDIELFGADVKAQRPALEWPDGVAPDPEAEARTLLALDQAGAISIEEKVRRLHPDWDDPEVAAEVEAIRSERGMSVEDPDAFTGADPAEQDPAEDDEPPGGSE